LLSIRDLGLLLTPEPTTWQYPHADGSPPREQKIIQQTVCFTELSANKLPKHAESFGNFALEFRIDTLRKMGALPVFYIPQASGENDGAESLGATLVLQIIDAMVSALRIETIKESLETSSPEEVRNFTLGFTEGKFKDFSLNKTEALKTIEALTYALTPPQMLRSGLNAALNFFYPTENSEYNESLHYYRQREWRITGNFAIKGKDVTQRPSEDDINKLLGIDAEFFGKLIETPSGMKKAADLVLVYPSLNSRPIIELANRVIVPAKAVDSAKTILSTLANPPPVVSITELDKKDTL